jgi:hypothetical protein
VIDVENSPFLKFCRNWWFVLGPIAALFCSLCGYLILESVGNPYWQVGDSYRVGNDYYRTILIVNPGPWSKRKPSIEFSESAHVELVGTSGWVEKQSDGTTLTVSAKSEIPPGIAFFVTYRCNVTNLAQSVPKVMCDAKACRDTPSTIDLDLVLKLLGIFMVGLLMGLFIFSVLFFAEKADHKKTKDGMLHQAVMELLTREQRRQGQADVEQAEQTVAGLPSPQKLTRSPAKPISPSKKNTGNKAQGQGPAAQK